MSGALIVTGASRGIGAAIARLGGERGFKICVNYNSAAGRTDEVVEAIRAGGGEAIAVKADVSKEAEVVAMFETVDRAFGPLAGLVNNAGVGCVREYVENYRLEDLESLFATNVFSQFLCACEAIRRMSTARGGPGGVIVNISSVSPKTGSMPGDVVYTASKGAMDAFTIALAKEAGGEGIRVCAVRPGITETEIFDTNVGLDAVKDMARKTVPLGRIGQPGEIATMTLWLCSEEASYVTGTLFDVSGGR
jgi:NAD(P)-dependent dehydrogenase (short-subunit alcohol dehydrogenase family)